MEPDAAEVSAGSEQPGGDAAEGEDHAPGGPSPDGAPPDVAVAHVEELVAIGSIDEVLATLGRLEARDTATPAHTAEVVAAIERVEQRMAERESAATAAAADLVAALERVERRIAERDTLAERDRDLVDKLHAENQRLRAGEIFQAIAPLARDLVRLVDQTRRLDAASDTPGTGDAALIEPQLRQLLARIGVEAYEPAPGDPFDPAWHHGSGRRPTDDRALDGTVAEVRVEGFCGPDGRPLRHAEVEVWRHDARTAPAAAGGSPTDEIDDVRPDVASNGYEGHSGPAARASGVDESGPPHEDPGGD